jgi:hypothetical protein
LWIEDTVMTFKGTKLPNLAIDMSGGNGNNWFQPFMGEGYVDNLPNGQEPGFKIDWAIDEDGNPVDLDHIDFVKVYTGQLAYCGWLGESSTEVGGAEDLHPDAVPVLAGDVNGDGEVTIGDVSSLIDRLLGSWSSPFDEVAADVNHDGQVTIGDVSQLIDILLKTK